MERFNPGAAILIDRGHHAARSALGAWDRRGDWFADEVGVANAAGNDVAGSIGYFGSPALR